MNASRTGSINEQALPAVCFLGLGVMGYPMAGHLARAGYPVTVYNRTARKALRWVGEFGGRSGCTPEAASRDADFVFACLGDDNDVREVVLGPHGALAGMKDGALFCDHTSASAHCAQELAQLGHARGVNMLDAPVSGGQLGAERGQLTIMVGGDPAVFARAEPLMRSYGKHLVHVGSSGCGQLAKMVNQICIAGMVQALAEALRFGQHHGLDMQKVLAAISQGAAQSWQMDNRAETMLEGRFDFGFAVEWMRKDLRLALQAAGRVGASLPITALVDQFYAQIQARGGGRWDTSSLIKLLEQSS